MSYPAFRCAACVNAADRCTVCRARRAKSIADRRAAHESAGLCVDCCRVAAVNVTTGETLLQCDAHLAANARRSGAAKRRARGVLEVLVLCAGIATTLVACAADGVERDDDAPSVAMVAGSAPSYDVAGNAAPPPVAVDAGTLSQPSPAGSAAPVVVEPPVAGTSAPSGADAGQPDPSPVTPPAPVAGAPADRPVTPTAAITHCKGLASGTVRSCTEHDQHYHGDTYVTWFVTSDASIGAGVGYNCNGDLGTQGTAPACVVGAECRIGNYNTGTSEAGVCQ